MKIKYDQDQDITLFLTEEENAMLRSGPTDLFSEMHCSSSEMIGGSYYILLRGLINELSEFIFLGCSRENLRHASDLDGMGEIVIPDSGSWSINLNGDGLEYYRNGWGGGVRYDGSHKLFIRRTDLK